MESTKELLSRYSHSPDEFPVLMQQTHKVLKDRKIVNERININENLIHYVQDTALLISEIDGSLKSDSSIREPYDHIVYLDKSARPVSWLVNMFWKEFAVRGTDGAIVQRPKHSYVNIDRSPWFRNVGISVSDDGRQKENGELATYRDFLNHIGNLTDQHLAEIRALYIEGGIEEENIEAIMESSTVLDGKRVLIVDEVSRTGSTLNIATHLFRLAFPAAKEVNGAYFWHPTEPMLKIDDENVLTSLPVWYDPNTLTGRGIGGIDLEYYRKRYEFYLEQARRNPNIKIKKLRAQAFSASVYSAPLLNVDGTVMDLSTERKTRELCRDLIKLHNEYKKGKIFFLPPYQWIDSDRYTLALEEQGVKLLPETTTDRERDEIRKSPLFFLNFIQKLKSMP